MSGSVFCCNNAQRYRPIRTDHDEKFNSFITAAFSSSGSASDPPSSASAALKAEMPYVIQFVKQVNFGAVESKRFFSPAGSPSATEAPAEAARFPNLYIELSEDDLIAANFKKVNAYKNFKCSVHNRFFELNLYQKDPLNKHHWRADVARPARDIDM